MNNKKPQNPVVVHKHKILKKIPHVSEMQYLTRVKKTSLNQRIKKNLILPTHHPQSFFYYYYTLHDKNNTIIPRKEARKKQ